MGQALSLDYFVVYVSDDDGKTWNPIHKRDVPKWIADDPDVMACLADERNCVQRPKESMNCYRAERFDPNSLN